MAACQAMGLLWMHISNTWDIGIWPYLFKSRYYLIVPVLWPGYLSKHYPALKAYRFMLFWSQRERKKMEEGPFFSMTSPLPLLSHMVTQVNAANICPHHLPQGLSSCFCNLDSSDILSNRTFSQLWEKLADVWWLWGYHRKSIKLSNVVGPNINHLSTRNLCKQEGEMSCGGWWKAVR